MKLFPKILTVATSVLLAAGSLAASAENIISQLGSDIDGEATDDNSGSSVSLSSDGTRVAIGAPGHDGGGSNSGHVRIYDWNGTAWAQAGSDIDGEATDDGFGASVSLSSDGTRVAIGATNNDGTGSNAGHVRVYDWTNGAWVQAGSDIDGEAAGDLFGASVSLSSDGTRVAIGAPYNDENGWNSGHVRIYDWTDGAWVQAGSDIDGEAANDYSGSSVSLVSDGTRVAIGAYANDGGGDGSGHVRIYDWTDGAWVQFGSDIDGEAANDYSGMSVAFSCLPFGVCVVAIGAPYNDGGANDAGHVRTYALTSDQVFHFGGDIDGKFAGDNSGWSVDIGYLDGNNSPPIIRVAIGAIQNVNRGSVAFYDFPISEVEPEWVRVGSYIDGEGNRDYSGSSVSLSGTGSRVAIGAPDNDGGGTDSGHVRIYSMSGLQPSSSASPSPSASASPSASPSSSASPTAYNVTFNANGGSGTMSGQAASSSTALTANTLTRDGFDFAGWNTATNGSGTDYADGANYAFTSDVSLYAQWIALPAPAPAPYSGPTPTNYSDKTPSIGDEVIISGLRMNLVTSLTIDGIDVPISNKSLDSFTIVIPIGISSGLKDLVMTGPAGKLNAQGALTIQQIIPAIINEALVSSKLNAGSFNGYVAVYAKGHKGKTLSWKIAGKWFKTTITSDYQVFQRRTAAVGLDVNVHLYINSEKQTTKTVRTR